MRNLFLFHMMLPTWMPFLSKILSTLNPFCLTYCPWNRWWQMFSMSTPWLVRPNFGKDALNFENPFDIFLDEEKTVRNIFKIIFRAPDFFTWLWLYIPTLQNNLEMLPQPGDMETILDLLGPIIDRLPKLLFLVIDQGQWLELELHILLRKFVHITSVPDRTHSYFEFDIFTTRNDRLPPNQVNKSLQRVGKQKLCMTPAVSRHQEETQMCSWRRLCRGHKDRLVRLFDPVPNVWEQITRVLQSYLVFWGG